MFRSFVLFKHHLFAETGCGDYNVEGSALPLKFIKWRSLFRLSKYTRVLCFYRIIQGGLLHESAPEQTKSKRVWPSAPICLHREWFLTNSNSFLQDENFDLETKIIHR